MEKTNKIITFTTDHQYDEADYKEFCKDNDMEYDENSYFDWLSDREAEDEEMDLEDLKNVGLTGNPNDLFLAAGMVGRWDGSYPGGRIDRIYNMIRALSNEDFIEMATDDEETMILTSNHDASSWFQVWLITKQGKQYLQALVDQNSTLTKEEIHRILLETDGFLQPVTREMVQRRWGSCNN